MLKFNLINNIEVLVNGVNGKTIKAFKAENITSQELKTIFEKNNDFYDYIVNRFKDIEYDWNISEIMYHFKKYDCLVNWNISEYERSYITIKTHTAKNYYCITGALNDIAKNYSVFTEEEMYYIQKLETITDKYYSYYLEHDIIMDILKKEIEKYFKILVKSLLNGIEYFNDINNVVDYFHSNNEYDYLDNYFIDTDYNIYEINISEK